MSPRSGPHWTPHNCNFLPPVINLSVPNLFSEFMRIFREETSITFIKTQIYFRNAVPAFICVTSLKRSRDNVVDWPETPNSCCKFLSFHRLKSESGQILFIIVIVIVIVINYNYYYYYCTFKCKLKELTGHLFLKSILFNYHNFSFWLDIIHPVSFVVSF